MGTPIEQALQSELARLRCIERILHDHTTVWQIEVAGHRAPMVVMLWGEILHITADFPALCPLEDEPVGYLLANGEPVYSVPLSPEVHLGRGFQVSVAWLASEMATDPS